MRFTHKAVLPLAAGFTVLAASGCTTASIDDAAASGQPAAAASKTAFSVNEQARALLPAAVRDKGTLVIGSDPTYPPFEYFDTDNKTMIGWDVDMGDALAQTLGLKAEHVAATFATILPGLTSQKYDAGMSAFGITDERQKAVDFCGLPFRRFRPSCGARQPAEALHEGGDAVRKKGSGGKGVAAQKGSSQSLDILPALSKECTDAGKPAIDAQLFPAQTDANLALTSGRVDAVMADSIPLAYEGTLAGKKFELAAGSDYQPEPIGIALPKDSVIRPAIEAAMKAIISGPVYGEINAKWSIPASATITADKITANQRGKDKVGAGRHAALAQPGGPHYRPAAGPDNPYDDAVAQIVMPGWHRQRAIQGGDACRGCVASGRPGRFPGDSGQHPSRRGPWPDVFAGDGRPSAGRP